MHKLIHQIEEKRQAIFVGFFGPIGVSAIFYLYISLNFLEGMTVDGVQRPDAEKLGEVMMVVIWFLAICSIVCPPSSLPPCHPKFLTKTQVVHGLSVPLGKLGFFLPRTLSRAFTSQDNSENNSFATGDRTISSASGILRERRKRRSPSSQHQGSRSRPHSSENNNNNNDAATSSTTTRRPAFRIGGSVIRDANARFGPNQGEDEPRAPSTPPAVAHERTIRFPDDDPMPSTRSEGPV